MNPNSSNAAEEEDFFSSPVTPAPAAAAPAAAAAVAVPPAPGTKPAAHTKVKPYHVGGGLFLVAAAVLFGNPFAGTSNAQTDPNAGALMTGSHYAAGTDTTDQFSSAVEPQTHGSNVPREAAQPPQQGPAQQPLPPQPVAQSAAVPAPSSSVPAGSMPANPMASNAAVSELVALRTQLAAMQGELVGLRADLTAARAAQPAAARPRTAAAPARPRQVAAVRAEADRGVLTGYRVNTIYPGQAWIEAGGKTFLVEPGTLVDGIRVTSIDAVSRRVHTTQGDIL